MVFEQVTNKAQTGFKFFPRARPETEINRPPGVLVSGLKHSLDQLGHIQNARTKGSMGTGDAIVQGIVGVNQYVKSINPGLCVPKAGAPEAGVVENVAQNNIMYDDQA
jgi:hypothetical protein